MNAARNGAAPPERGVEVRGRTRRGRACRLVDRSGDALPRAELERLLADLIAAEVFEFRAQGDARAVRLGRPSFGHVQIGERLYRLIVERGCARVEKF